MTKKPLTIKVIIGLLITKLFIILFIILTFAAVKDIDSSTRSAAAAIKDTLARRYHLDMSDTSYAFGKLMGTYVISVTTAILGLIFILKRKYIPAMVTLIADIIIGIAMMSPIIPLVNLILFFQKKSKVYMKGIYELPEDKQSIFPE